MDKINLCWYKLYNMNITNDYLLLKFLAKMSSVPNLLRGMLENAKPANDGSNFSDWYLKLCIVLRCRDMSGEELFGCASSEDGAHLVEHLLLGCYLSLFG